jgi:hypothetical protein
VEAEQPIQKWSDPGSSSIADALQIDAYFLSLGFRSLFFSQEELS